MNKILIIISSVMIPFNLICQTINRKDLKTEKIPEISAKNDSLLNKVQLPLIYNRDNGLAYRIHSTNVLYNRPDPEPQNFERITNEYLIKNNVKDNGTKKERYAITIRGSQFILSKHQTIKRYIFYPDSYVNSYISIDETPGYDANQVFCIFNDNAEYSNTNIEFDTICALKGENTITPNKRITYKDSQNNYEFVYTATLCTDRFQYQGFGTILPTFINLKLTIKDKKTGKTQTIYQASYDYRKLHYIILGDINNDNKKDLVLQFESDLCQIRLIYLTELDIKKAPFKYIGNMIIYCDYP
jgi:hypothetical protein